MSLETGVVDVDKIVADTGGDSFDCCGDSFPLASFLSLLDVVMDVAVVAVVAVVVVVGAVVVVVTVAIFETVFPADFAGNPVISVSGSNFF